MGLRGWMRRRWGPPSGSAGMRGAGRGGDGWGWAWPMAGWEGVMGGGVCKGLLRGGRAEGPGHVSSYLLL